MLPYEFAREILGEEKIILFDVGARGLGGELNEIAPLVECYAFEPEKDEYERLVNNSNGLKQKQSEYASIKYDNHAIHGKSGERTLFVMENAKFSSLLEPDSKIIERFPYWHSTGGKFGESLRVKNKISVGVDTLDAVTKKRFKVDHIDYLKLDTHGNELDILKGAGRLLDEYRISVIKCEVWFQNFYKSQALFSDIDTFLRKKGFMFIDLHPINAFHKLNMFYPPAHNDNGMLYFSNAYYCLDIDALATRFANEQAKLLKCGLILIYLGYSGWGSEILKKPFMQKFGKEKIADLYQIMRKVSWRKKASSAVKQFFPPAFVSVLKKIESMIW